MPRVAARKGQLPTRRSADPQKHTLDGTPYYFNTMSEALSWDKPAALRTAEEREEAAGTWVWVRDPDQGWASAQLLEDDGSQVTVKQGQVRASCVAAPPHRPLTAVAAQEKRTLTRGPDEPLWTFFRSELHDCPDDVVTLRSINEAQIAHALRQRFQCAGRPTHRQCPADHCPLHYHAPLRCVAGRTASTPGSAPARRCSSASTPTAGCPCIRWT